MNKKTLKYIIEAFQKFFLLNELAKLKSKWKSYRRSKSYIKGFNWVMVSYFIDNRSLDYLSSQTELKKDFSHNNMKQAFASGAEEALNIIWLQFGFNTGYYKSNMK